MKSTDKDRLYLGKAGEFRIMAEFLARGYNVAMPEVDVGDDVLVVKDENHGLQRLQVKTSRLNGALQAQFTISREQLETPDPVDLWYVFLARTGNHWLPPLLIAREDLLAVQTARVRTEPGKQASDGINFQIRFTTDGTQAWLASRDLSCHLDNWRAWPSILKTGSNS